MNISEIIGLKITEIRYTYTYQNEYDLQEFYSYMQLSNGFIIRMPQYSDIEIYKDEELNKVFKNAKRPSIDCKKKVENQKIIDIHYCFYEQEADDEDKAYLELENGYYITEQNFGPMGVTTVDLKILTKTEFEKIKTELEEDFEIRSYQSEIKNVS